MLDWDRISELRGEVGDAEFQVILEMFLDEVESAMMRLSAKDPKRLETSLHFLKGCAWNLGFSAFGGLCDEEERRAADGHAEDVGIDGLLACYSESKKAMMRGLDASLRPLPRAEEA
ncbi:Hpt domain-containing protein [Paracoccus lutimaris]|uniref:Hpt domain-containing protein n=1 Tax=Paracoccus lutimaris TaxID=1490030 RepID=A0A368ZAD2_9RHOB|nr:Hpt domain-containing protein [Paracoccus lutimaris]RCW88147.1 Hpt domain-containing protein [Paracoccus lutimaris]